MAGKRCLKGVDIMKLRFFGSLQRSGTIGFYFLTIMSCLTMGSKWESHLNIHNGVRPEVSVLSHCHIDHSGLLPNLMDIEPEVFIVPPTADLANLLLKDSLKIAESTGVNAPYDTSDLHTFMYKTKTVDYRIKFQTHGYNVEFYDASHIPGSGMHACNIQEWRKSAIYRRY